MATTKTVEKTKNGQLNQGDRSEQGAAARGLESAYAPRVDIVETNDAFRMFAFMPGVKADDVSLHCKDGELIVHGRCLPRSPGKRMLHQEYGVGDFYRTFALNDQIDTTKIDATIENGVLTLTLPKTEAAKPKRITVKGA